MTMTNKILHTIVEEQIQLKPHCKLVISDIARKAGVSNATVHNRHPDVLEKISAHNAKFLQASVKVKNAKITKLKLEKASFGKDKRIGESKSKTCLVKRLL